uniref:Uncharacterized protein n=1 Tax=Romanomermis culicivorax TaxID=13658 RepID=A0A915L6N1_ROMCU
MDIDQNTKFALTDSNFAIAAGIDEDISCFLEDGKKWIIKMDILWHLHQSVLEMSFPLLMGSLEYRCQQGHISGGFGPQDDWLILRGRDQMRKGWSPGQWGCGGNKL